MPRCPKCGEPVVKGGTHPLYGYQRWKHSSRKDMPCKWHGTRPVGIEEAQSKGIDAEKMKDRARALRGDRSKVKRYVITSAQNATPVFKPVLDSLMQYCKLNGAELIVIPFRYHNPTSVWSEKAKGDDWWAPEFAPYLLDRRIALNKNIVLLADIKTQPTAHSPLQGFETLTGGQSAVIGHPKIELTTIPTPQNKLPKILATTGAVTKPNYLPSKAGKRGEHHHVYGACLVAVNGDKFFMRQLIASSDGTFCDLTWKYSPEGRAPAAVEALVMGDTHFEFIDPGVVKATFTAKDSIVNALKPKHIVFHDLHDFFSRNHHHAGDPFIELAKHQSGTNNVEAALDRTFAFVDEHSPPYAINVLVPSNHPDALARWIKEANPKTDPVNCVFWARTFEAMCLGTTMKDSGPSTIDPFAYWAKRKLRSAGRTMFLERDQSFRIRGVELGNHGDRGANGARGSRAAYGKIGVKTVIGHSHSPGIKDGVVQVGTNSRLRLGYNSGPSSWMHADAVVYENGKRSLIFIVGDEWHA